MATFNLAITYPDGQASRIAAALKADFPNDDGSEPTTAQALERFREETRRQLRNRVLRHERRVFDNQNSVDIT